MKIIQIKVQNKIAKLCDDRDTIVCDNNDYVIRFDFDKEWGSQYIKTARFIFAGQYKDVVFNGTDCLVPIIRGADSVSVGVFAGDLKCTTPAVINCQRSILNANLPESPENYDDVYAQLMALINKRGSMIYVSTGEPDDALGVSGDLAIDTTNSNVYQKAAEWEYKCNIRGLKGDKGDQGERGTEVNFTYDASSGYLIIETN